jgi:centrin-3
MRALGFDVKKEEVKQLISEYDRSGKGLIEFPDFLEISTFYILLHVDPVVTQKIIKRDPAEEIHKAFKLFDDDNTGKISIKNLRRVAKELNENLADEELQAMIEEFDLDKDGQSTYFFLEEYLIKFSKRIGVYSHHDSIPILVCTVKNLQ